jgi:hypothetical protein
VSAEKDKNILKKFETYYRNLNKPPISNTSSGMYDLEVISGCTRILNNFLTVIDHLQNLRDSLHYNLLNVYFTHKDF